MMAFQHAFWRRNLRLPAFKLLLFSLWLIMTNISTLSFSTMRIQNALEQKAAEFLGGDLKLSSPIPPPLHFENTAHELGLSTAKTIEFLTMLSHSDNAVLSEVKAVDEHYPLIGSMQVFTSDPTQLKTLPHGPKAGKIWLEPRLLNLLHVSLGDTLSLGKKSFEIEYLIHVEPDKINSGFFSPRAMISEADLANTELIQPGSRAQYYLLVTGSPDNCLRFEKAIQSDLQPNQTLINAMNNKSVAQRIVDNSSIYVYFSGFINVLLAGIALYFSVKQYLKTQISWVAFLKCTGILPRTIIQWYLSGLLLFGSGSLFIGMICGWGLSDWGLSVLTDYLPQITETRLSSTSAVFSFIIVNLLFLGFIFPFIQHLSKTPTIQVINRQAHALEFDFTYYAFGLGFLCLIPFLFQGHRDIIMAMTMGFISITAIFLIFFRMLLTVFSLLSRHLNPLFRYIFAEFVYHRSETSLQLLIFTLLLSIMITLYSVKTQLLSQWFSDLPSKTPNYFLINISEEMRKPLQDFSKHINLPLNRLYPIVRGRLFKVNGKPLLDSYYYSEKRGLNRLWSLTFTNELPPKNQILQGHWFASAPVETEVSLEKDIAESIGLNLGDMLSFQVDEQVIEARLSSIRSVSWQTFQPNFFAIFPENIGNSFIKSYITSVYIPLNKPDKLKQLSHDFPNLYVIDINMLIDQIKRLYDQVSRLISGLFLYSFSFSLLIFFSITRANAMEQISNNYILHIIGIKKYTIQTINFSQYFLIGLISAFSAIVISTVVSDGLLQHIFHVSYQFNPILAILSLLFAPLLGFFGQQCLPAPNKKAPQEDT